jgi:hypothetical protein
MGFKTIIVDLIGLNAGACTWIYETTELSAYLELTGVLEFCQFRLSIVDEFGLITQYWATFDDDERVNCDLAYIRQTADGKHLLRCTRCPREQLVADPTKRRRAACGKVAKSPKDGPGTELAGVAKELKLKEKPGCGCEEMRREMNRLGVAGCRRDRKRLASKLRAKAGSFGLSEKARAALAAATSGIALTINWLDPYPGLIALAIDRAEARTAAA